MWSRPLCSGSSPRTSGMPVWWVPWHGSVARSRQVARCTMDSGVVGSASVSAPQAEAMSCFKIEEMLMCWRELVPRPKCDAAAHFQQNPRKWRSTVRQGDHTQLEVFPSEMRCRGVVLLASRISVPSPATPCTLITPNGAPRGLISRICFLPFTGANAGARLRISTS